jgi:UDP-N-acetylglucosamine diphosphorylase/glucosamine-1-phosphate N-acetyltransferase
MLRAHWLEASWELVRYLAELLAADILTLGAERACVSSPATVIGEHPVFVEAGAQVEPLVVIDASAGPVLVSRGARIAAFTRLVGPCYVAAESQVLGGKVGTSAIGEQCRVHGEVNHVIFIGHANKSHDGFVGHSVLGRWVNLGAETVTSNLKNTYGTVQFWTPAGLQPTGMQFLGTLFGDHAKTAIGTRLSTGSVIGAGANVVGSGMTPKVVAPFTWGESDTTYDPERFVTIAERMMARRGVSLGDRARRHLLRIFTARGTTGK